jgi:pimeloyl-ACP methyl ester carboxylesterase
MTWLCRDGLRFCYRDEGAGLPFAFQHGLGADVSQPFGIFLPPPGVRLLAFDCRAHGDTRPLGDPVKIRIAAFADDLLALLDSLGIQRGVIGGISMGAGVALNFVLRYPERTLGLVLSRPAWLNQPLPPHLAVYPRMAALIREFGSKRGREVFERSPEYAAIRSEAPASADSLLSQFEDPRAEEAVVRLEQIPRDAPNLSRDEWRSLTVPTLVLANREDVIHPFEYGKALAQNIPGAEFKELTPKAVNERRHAADVQRFIGDFLQQHFLRKE